MSSTVGIQRDRNIYFTVIDFVEECEFQLLSPPLQGRKFKIRNIQSNPENVLA